MSAGPIHSVWLRYSADGRLQPIDRAASEDIVVMRRSSPGERTVACESAFAALAPRGLSKSRLQLSLLQGLCRRGGGGRRRVLHEGQGCEEEPCVCMRKVNHDVGAARRSAQVTSRKRHSGYFFQLHCASFRDPSSVGRRRARPPARAETGTKDGASQGRPLQGGVEPSMASRPRIVASMLRTLCWQCIGNVTHRQRRGERRGRGSTNSSMGRTRCEALRMATLHRQRDVGVGVLGWHINGAHG